MREPSIEDVADQFDAVYTRLTALQRQLIAARRNGLDDQSTRELIREAAAIVAVVSRAERTGDLVAPSIRDTEAAALRARVLVEPVDGLLVMMAARAQSRAHAYRLLAEVIEMDSAMDAWHAWSVLEVLAAPQKVGESTARRLADRTDFRLDQSIGQLDPDTRARLVASLREWADRLPSDVSGRTNVRRPPDDGRGATADVLSRWVDPIGPASDPVRLAAREAAQRDGWPADAVPTVKVLLAFTHAEVMPRLVPGFGDIAAAESTDEGLIAALRAEERGYRDAWWTSDDPDSAEMRRAGALAWALRTYVEALQAARKAEQQSQQPRDEWRGAAPLAHARGAARRCGKLLALLDEDCTTLLGGLPKPRPSAS